MKRQLTDWGKNTSHISDKGLLSRIHKELSNSTKNKKQTTQVKNGQKKKKLNGCLTKEDTQMENKHMKICSTSVIIREIAYLLEQLKK